MPNLNELIINSATCSIMITIPTAAGDISFPLKTVANFDFNDASSGELIYAIGSRRAIGNQSNEDKFDGKISLQLGEINAILQICGFQSSIEINGASIAVAALTGGFAKSYSNVNCNSDSSAIKAKDKETLVNIDWLAQDLGF